MLSGRRSKIEVHPTFDTAFSGRSSRCTELLIQHFFFYKMVNSIGEIYERTCDKELLYVAYNKFL